MSQALYRRYRSKSFDDVVGQEHITTLLNQAVKRGVISHAYLFTGPRGVGKTSVARILAHAINNLPYSESAHLDIIEIDAASNRRIDDIRDLREKVHIAPTSANYKVYIIDEVHMLTGESFNALLKTLEEPPAHVIFILATTELHKVPATIISRTQRFHFRPGSHSSIVKHLKVIAKKEKIDIQSDAIDLIAEHSEGGYRDALSLLDQVAGSSDQTINRAQVEQLLGLASSNSVNQLADSIINGDTAAATTNLKSLYEQGTNPVVIAGQLSRMLARRADEQPTLYTLLNDLLDVNRSSVPDLKLLALVAGFIANKTTASSSKQPNIAASAAPAKTLASRPFAKKIASDQNKLEDEPAQAAEEMAQPSANKPGDASPATDQELSWPAILEITQKRAPAIYGVLRRAEVECSSDKITLTFQYALHRKKLSDARYRSQLAAIIENTFNCRPEIVITDKTEQPLSSEVAAVADIMGGGKPVNA